MIRYGGLLYYHISKKDYSELSNLFDYDILHANLEEARFVGYGNNFIAIGLDKQNYNLDLKNHLEKIDTKYVWDVLAAKLNIEFKYKFEVKKMYEVIRPLVQSASSMQDIFTMEDLSNFNTNPHFTWICRIEFMNKDDALEFKFNNIEYIRSNDC